MKISFQTGLQKKMLRDAKQGQAVRIGNMWYLHAGDAPHDDYDDDIYVRLLNITDPHASVFSHNIGTVVDEIRNVAEIIIDGVAPAPVELPF